MRVIYTIFFFFLSSYSWAQNNSIDSINLVSYKPGTVLDIPDFDSLQFEFRYFNWGFGTGETYLQITFDNQNNWNYRTGYLTYDSSLVRVTELNLKPINWTRFWEIMDSLNVKELSDQRDLKLVLTHDNGNQSVVDSQRYFEHVMDGNFIYLEFINPDSFISISYDNPTYYEKSLEQHNLTGLTEHRRFNYAVSTIHNYFDMKSPSIQQVYERIDTSEVKKKAKKKKKKNGL